MFGGPDAQLVQDAIVIAALALAVGFGLSFSFMRLGKNKHEALIETDSKGSIEERIEVLERIATDRSIDLAEEIDALNSPKETA